MAARSGSTSGQRRVASLQRLALCVTVVAVLAGGRLVGLPSSGEDRADASVSATGDTRSTRSRVASDRRDRASQRADSEAGTRPDAPTARSDEPAAPTGSTHLSPDDSPDGAGDADGGRAVLALTARSLVDPATVAAIDESGELDGAPYRVVVPKAWNGTLVVFAHGFRAAAPDLVTPEDRSVMLGPARADVDALLAAGYGLAGTAYRSNGWAIEDATGDVAALALHAFDRIGGRPPRVVVWGESMGGLVTVAAIEARPDVFDGAIALCGIVGGSLEWWDTNGLALAEAYAAAFGWPARWGTPEHPAADLSWADDVAPLVSRQLGDPANQERFEFIRLAIGADPSDFYTGGLWLTMSLATEARVELTRRAGGQPLSAPDDGWMLDLEARRELTASGLDVDTLLGAMNRRAALVETDGAARAYLAAHAEPSGELTRPVLSIHTAADTIVPLDNQERYRQRVVAAGSAGLLAQAVVPTTGHCTFTPETLTGALSTMTDWLETGAVPSPAELLGVTTLAGR